MSFTRLARWDNQEPDEAMKLDDFLEKYTDKINNWENLERFVQMLISAG